MKEDSVIELWVAFDLLLKEPELQGLSSQVFSAEDDTRLYAFLLANLDDKLTEQEQVEILESFMGVVYQSAASVYESLPADNRRTKLADIFAKTAKASPFGVNFTENDQRLFLDSLDLNEDPGLAMSDVLIGSYLTLKVGEKAIKDFNAGFSIVEKAANIR